MLRAEYYSFEQRKTLGSQFQDTHNEVNEYLQTDASPPPAAADGEDGAI